MDQLSVDELSAVRELLDKHAIYENLVKYCRGMDRQDIELLKDAYWEDGTDDHGSFVGGAHEFCEFALANKGLFEHLNHNICNTQIELLGEQAKSETYFIAVHMMPGSDTEQERAWLLGGRYRDLLEKRNGLWKILHRVCLWDWNLEQPVDRTSWTKYGLGDSPNQGKFAPDDPIYANWFPA